MKKEYKYIFVVLTYRNAEDLYDMDKSLKILVPNYHIIVVNSYYDEDTENRIKHIANELSCSFISVNNRGYGAGNNAGVKYALSQYEFRYIVIANADLVFRVFKDEYLPTENAIIGPALTTIRGKAQNPYWNKKNEWIERIIYLGHKRKSRWSMYFGQGLNRIRREFFLRRARNKAIIEVYAVHGACVLFTADAAKKLFPIYDENMFLYYEEAYLARKANTYGINVFYYPEIDVLHKEDGSTKGLDLDLSKHATSSYIYYYENNDIKAVEREGI